MYTRPEWSDPTGKYPRTQAFPFVPGRELEGLTILGKATITRDSFTTFFANPEGGHQRRFQQVPGSDS